jgi:hypothetical protein
MKALLPTKLPHPCELKSKQGRRSEPQSLLVTQQDPEEKKFSDRDTESVSNRSLLANALEGVAQNDIERKRLAD